MTRNNRHSVDMFLQKLHAALKDIPTTHSSLLTEPVFSHVCKLNYILINGFLYAVRCDVDTSS